MDLLKTIGELRSEKEKLDRVILSLEQLQAAAARLLPGRSGRGRKFMSAAERQEVSDRMKRYWDRRRDRVHT
jgi:hypothetical protein